MVEKSGTSFGADIPIRVSNLEGSVDQLHTDNQAAQRTLAGLVSQIDSVRQMLMDVAGKLDQARTQKPNVGTIAAAVSVLITIAILAFAPVYRDQADNREFHAWATEQIVENLHWRAEHAEREADQLREQLGD